MEDIHQVRRLYGALFGTIKKQLTHESVIMQMIDQFVDVDADLRKVYNQWTQFEDFPEFMAGVEKVQQLDARRLHWVANIGGRQLEWDAEIYEQIPDLIIAWRSINGEYNEGHIRFERLGPDKTRVHVQFVYEPKENLKKASNAVAMLGERVSRDLKRFKDFIENRPQETGAWRGIIHGGRVNRGRVRAMGPRSQRLRRVNRMTSLDSRVM